MSTPAHWLNDLALLPDQDMANWQPLQHQAETRHLSGDELATALAALGPVSGWLMCTGQVHRLHQQPVPATTGILSGEFHSTAGEGQAQTCWQLSHQGRDQWQLHTHHIQVVPSGAANALGERISHRHVDGGHLHYYRLWQPDNDQAPQCRIALLTGIQEPSA